MEPTPRRVLALALVCSSVASVFAGVAPTSPQSPSGGPTVLGPVTDLTVTNGVVAPDGFSRSTILAGGTLPGPLIAANKGDDFKINVVNLLNDTSLDTDTSVHWHGIFEVDSNWADGTASVTQCPIKPNGNFTHQFSVPSQTGTYWYHSHYSAQYCDGLRGPLVIYDDDDPLQDMYDVDDASTVITLGDWYHVPSLDLTRGPYFSNATLVNGNGRYAGGPATPLSVFNVAEDQRYRFRIVSVSCDAMFNFSIDGHLMTVIETDGIETQPLVVDSLTVYPGQRYSIVLNATEAVDNYWIRAASDNLFQSFDGWNNTAILRYEGAPAEDPTTVHGPYVLPYSEGNVHPLISPGAPGVPAPGQADVNINLVPGYFTTETGERFTINNVSFSGPPLPVLLQMLNGVAPQQLLPNGSIYEVPRGSVVEVSVPATDLTVGGAPGPHTIHLHGHTFDVIRTPGSSTYNFANPIRRDTIHIGTQAENDNVTFRFTTDNPGAWFLHCHTNFHLRDGFAAVFAEAPADAVAEEEKAAPDYWYNLCK